MSQTSDGYGGDDPPFGDPEYYAFFCQAQPAVFVRFIHLMPLTPPAGGRYVLGLVRVIDENGQGVGGATVDLTWSIPPGGGYEIPQTRTTAPSGIAAGWMLGPWTGAYELCVDKITAPGYVYDPGQNYETCDALLLP